MASLEDGNRRIGKDSRPCVKGSPAPAPEALTKFQDLVRLVSGAYQSGSQGEHCAITSRAKSLNGPYNFEEMPSLHPGRAGPGAPLIVASIDRESGIKQIRENFLARKDEHSWIYVPCLGLWIDDTTEIEQHGVVSDPFLRTILLRTYPEIEVFHTHPDGLYSELHQEGHLPGTYLMIAATPSRGDQFAASMLEEFAGPRTRLKSHVISHFGVTSYYQTEEFRANENLAAQPFDWDYDSIDDKASPVEEIARICQSLEDRVAAATSTGPSIRTWTIGFAPFKE